jgi:hypothetical protein
MLAGAEARQVVADGPYVIAIQFCQQTDVALREVRTSSIHRVIDLATQVLVMLRSETRNAMLCVPFSRTAVTAGTGVRVAFRSVH